MRRRGIIAAQSPSSFHAEVHSIKATYVLVQSKVSYSIPAPETEEIVVVQSPVEDIPPAPSARITLMHGRRSSGKPPLYLNADGTGSIATYVYLPTFKSKIPVYGIDSPHLRCPSRLTAEVSIPTKSFTEFMEDAKMGAIAWGLPHNPDADLGPNGWDRNVGETLCLSIDADHLEMPIPGHVYLFHRAMEEALSYSSCPDH